MLHKKKKNKQEKKKKKSTTFLKVECFFKSNLMNLKQLAGHRRKQGANN